MNEPLSKLFQPTTDSAEQARAAYGAIQLSAEEVAELVAHADKLTVTKPKR